MLYFRTILNPLFLIPFIILSFCKTFACDTTPTLTGSNVIDNGDGTYYMDISACIGSGGSADGFDLYFNNDINVLKILLKFNLVLRLTFLTAYKMIYFNDIKKLSVEQI